MLDHIPRYFVDQPYTVVIGRPSASLVENLETVEKDRLAAQVEKLGPEGLAKAAQELEDAKAEHDLPIPKEILTSFPVPHVNSISWIPVKSVQELGKGRTVTSRSLQSDLKKRIEGDGEPLPIFVQYDHVKVSFLFAGPIPGLTDLLVRFCGNSCVFLAYKCAGRASPVRDFFFLLRVFLMETADTFPLMPLRSSRYP